MRPVFSALPSKLSLNGPLNMSGNSVTTSTLNGAFVFDIRPFDFLLILGAIELLYIGLKHQFQGPPFLTPELKSRFLPRPPHTHRSIRWATHPSVSLNFHLQR